MAYVLIKHRVKDFQKWKVGYDADAPARNKAGLVEEHLFRNIDDPNEVLVLFSAEDVDRAREMAESELLHDLMRMVGVIGEPDVCFLN